MLTSSSLRILYYEVAAPCGRVVVAWTAPAGTSRARPSLLHEVRWLLPLAVHDVGDFNRPSTRSSPHRRVSATTCRSIFAVERKVVAEDLKELIPPGTRSVSIFLVNRREPLDDQPDRSFTFQSELEIHASSPFVPCPDPRGVLAARQRRQRYLVPRGVVVDPEVRGERAPMVDCPKRSPPMSTAAALEPVPLSTDPQGVIRIAGTRVRLDTVVYAFETGGSPEEIAEDYPLQLDDVYAVITYYLRHREEVEAYLEKRRRQADAVRHENEARFDHRGLRARLLARLENAST
jgi:uncharacterized protein (DUF433 family)